MTAVSQAGAEPHTVPAAALAESGQPAGPPAVDPEVVRTSLRCSIKDGMAWSVMHGAGERYLQPFVIIGNQSLLRLGAISALPAVAGAIIQCVAAEVADTFGRRRRMFVWSSVLQALTWLPICAAIFLPMQTAYWLMLGSYALFVALHNFGLPAWTSLMGDLVPADRRGRYFGLRNCLTGLMLMLAFLGGGWWLTYCRDDSRFALLGLSSQNFAFLTLFALACVARFVSAWYLSRMYEPAYRPHPRDRFTLLEFIRRAPRAQFGRFVFYWMLLNVGGGFIGPYLSWYMLSELHFSPLAFAWILTANLLALFGTQPLWGRLSDRVGSKRVLAIGGLGAAVIPALLLVSDNMWYYAAVQVYDGVAWAAYGIGATNYLFDIVTPPKRARCAAYSALFVALGGLIGTFAAGLVATYVPLPLSLGGVTITHPFTILLIGSTILRLLPNVLLLGSFQEYRLRPGANDTGLARVA